MQCLIICSFWHVCNTRKQNIFRHRFGAMVILNVLFHLKWFFLQYSRFCFMALATISSHLLKKSAVFSWLKFYMPSLTSICRILAISCFFWENWFQEYMRRWSWGMEDLTILARVFLRLVITRHFFYSVWGFILVVYAMHHSHSWANGPGLRNFI